MLLTTAQQSNNEIVESSVDKLTAHAPEGALFAVVGNGKAHYFSLWEDAAICLSEDPDAVVHRLAAPELERAFTVRFAS